VGVHGYGETRGAEEQSSNGREGWGSGGGDVPLLTGCGVWGSAVNFPRGVRGEASATWRFGTLYRLTKPFLLVQILNVFQ